MKRLRRQILKNDGIKYFPYTTKNNESNLNEINDMNDEIIVLNYKNLLPYLNFFKNKNPTTLIKKLKKLKNVKKNYQKKIIIYLRRQDTFYESSYAQIIKTGTSMSFGEYIKKLNPYNISYLKLLNVIEKIFGKENVIVKYYEDIFLWSPHRYIINFFKSIKKHLSMETRILIKANKAIKSSNKRYTLESYQKALSFNINHEKRVGTTKYDSEIKRMRYKLEKYEKDNNKSGKVTFFSNTERTKLLKHFEKENKIIFKKYPSRTNFFLLENDKYLNSIIKKYEDKYYNN